MTAPLMVTSACSDDPSPTPDPIDPVVVDPAASREREIRGGRLHDTALAGITDADLMDALPLVSAVQADLRGRLGALRPTDFVELDRRVTAAGGGARLSHVTMRQTIGGVPVEETYLHVGVRYGNGQPARLVSSSFRLFDNASLDTNPGVPRDRALLLAREGLRLRGTPAPRSEELVIRRIDGRLQLAWSFGFDGSTQKAYVIAGGAAKGRVVAIDQRIYETTGTVSGNIVRGGAPGGLGTPDTVGLGHVHVSGTSASTTADGAGAYAITVPDGELLGAGLDGTTSTILDVPGAPVTASAPAVDGGITNLALSAATEGTIAQITAYYFVDQVRTFLEANGVDNTALGGSILTRTNIPDICNAYYDPGEISINFFASGGGCNNSATDSIVAHEYGHFVDDMLGGIFDGGLSEGWGDLISCLYLGVPEVGYDLLPGTALRSCQNDYLYPPGGFDEVHELGKAWPGFGWDVRQGLIADLGPVDGEALARALLIPSLGSNAPDIPTAVREAFLRDDDDGDLDNQTPHWNVLYAAAENHGLVFAIDPDLDPPAPISDLAVVDAQATQIAVQWTATGDDGLDGTASAYELRWATFAIDDTNFGAANLAATGAPQPSGSVETAIVPAIPGATIWIALVAIDEQFNVSGLSNVVSATTPEGTVVWEEGTEGGAGDWTATGLWHVTERRASEGTHSFWYGDELTGNYDTGGNPNAGVLTSPVIDLGTASGAVFVYDQWIDVEPDPYDTTVITVTNVDDPTETVSFGKDTFFSGGAFVPRVIPLTGFDGDRVQISFGFDTIDGVFNATEGWYLDHLRIVASDSCAHGLCFEGPPLDPTCSECVADVCAVDSFCCEFGWDSLCVQEAQDICGIACTTCGNGACEPGETPETCPADCQPACAHGVCEPGVALEPTCDSCVSTVCAVDDFCCTVFWDRVCVDEAEDLCGAVCEGCAHDTCAVGDPLEPGCDTCVDQVCSFDPYCCSNAWDSRCVEEAADTCGLSCEVCSHDLCDQGNPLEVGCDPCVTAVCDADPFCCNNTWDERCVEAAQTTCGLSCAEFR